MGAAHFGAQTVNKFIFGRLPMNRYLVLPFVPLIALSRSTRELLKLLRVRRMVTDLSAIPYLLLGSVIWGLSYARASRFLEKKCVSETG